jgi:hypothetical protein
MRYGSKQHQPIHTTLHFSNHTHTTLHTRFTRYRPGHTCKHYTAVRTCSSTTCLGTCNTKGMHNTRHHGKATSSHISTLHCVQ